MVRREAQVAMVVFRGWNSIPFFANLTYPISLWQQIRIIEKLKVAVRGDHSKSAATLVKSTNIDILELTLRLIFELNLTDEFDFISAHQTHPNPKIAEIAKSLTSQLELSALAEVELNKITNKTLSDGSH